MPLTQGVLTYLPYLTTSIFVVGLLWRVRRWWRAPAPAAPLFPAPAGSAAVWGRIGAEICLLRGRHATQPTEGLGAWIFHACLAGIFVGHIRTVTDFPRLWAALSLPPADVDRLSGLVGGAMGDIALAAGLYLLARRLVLPRLRQITRFEDIFVLALLLGVLASGQVLRFGPPVDLGPVRDYLAALASLSPRPMPDIPGFAAHFLLVQVLAVYAPFGKLLHIAGVFPAKLGLTGAD